MSDWYRHIEDDGYAVLPGVFTADEVETIARELAQALEGSAEASLRSQDGTVYAARNVLQVWPPAREIWRREPLPAILSAILGPDFGLVRGLFFDKPPGQTWGLPWHKDLTIAVRNNRLPSSHFCKPTRKAGVPHVEAPLEVLQGMLTARLHLDDMTSDNGPLRVIPGSHRLGKTCSDGSTAALPILGRRGDVLLIRPLVEHCSGRSREGTTLHRRVLHLEFAASAVLPDGYAWHDFIPGELGSRLFLCRGSG